jgi:DNA-directed RNA polymerase subunit RPC12/RpoP
MKSKTTKVYYSYNPEKLEYYNSIPEPEMHQCNRCKKIVNPSDKLLKPAKKGWSRSVCKSCGGGVFLKVKIIKGEKNHDKK